jgi:hypothetical protein
VLRRGIPDRHLQTVFGNGVHQTSGLSTGLPSHPGGGERSIYYCIEGNDTENAVPPVDFQSITSQYRQYQNAKSNLDEPESPYVEFQNRINSTKDEKMSVTSWEGLSPVGRGLIFGFPVSSGFLLGLRNIGAFFKDLDNAWGAL